ncbi:Flp pilus assembly complex ATPase component TadA, partial [bacterium]|nr:Flp pilus assembly complex ATPase component TadA [bacterium]
MEKKLIGEILIEKGLISKDQFEHALELQASSGKKIGDILVDLKYITRDKIEQVMADQVYQLTQLDISSDILNLITADYARKHSVLPIRKEKNTLVVAMDTSSNFNVTDDIEFMTKCSVEVVVCGKEDILQAIRFFYGQDENIKSDGQEYSDSFNKEINNIAKQIIDAGEEEAPIAKFVSLLIFEAIKRRASDIHLEPLINSFRIRYRIDGVLHEVSAPPIRLQGAVISRIKLMAGMDIAEKRLPQDGRIKFSSDKEDVDLRVSSLPGIHGESIVLRILDKASLLINLHELGLRKEDAD